MPYVLACKSGPKRCNGAEHAARPERMGRMIETSPWPEQPRSMPAAKKYSIEPYKGFYVVMKEMAGRKELVVVAVYKKGAEAVKTLVEGPERQLAEATCPQQVRHDNGTSPAPRSLRLSLHRPRPEDRGAAETRGRRHLGTRAYVHCAGGRVNAVAVPACRPARVFAVFGEPADASGEAGSRVFK